MEEYLFPLPCSSETRALLLLSAASTTMSTMTVYSLGISQPNPYHPPVMIRAVKKPFRLMSGVMRGDILTSNGMPPPQGILCGFIGHNFHCGQSGLNRFLTCLTKSYGHISDLPIHKFMIDKEIHKIQKLEPSTKVRKRISLWRLVMDDDQMTPLAWYGYGLSGLDLEVFAQTCPERCPMYKTPGKFTRSFTIKLSSYSEPLPLP